MYRVDVEIKGDDACKPVSLLLLACCKHSIDITIIIMTIYCYYIGGSAALVSVLPPTLVSIPIYMLADRQEEAESLYRKAAEQGSVDAIKALARRDRNKEDPLFFLAAMHQEEAPSDAA